MQSALPPVVENILFPSHWEIILFTFWLHTTSVSLSSKWNQFCHQIIENISLNSKQSESEWSRWNLGESEEEIEDWLASLGNHVIAMCDE